MATVINNHLVEGLSGMLGNTLVFRNVSGKTVVSSRPGKPRRQSEQQRENRDRFRNAAFFAKTCMLDPQKKQYYRAQARKLGLPNAYTAALTDFMRKPAVETVNRKGPRVMVRPPLLSEHCFASGQYFPGPSAQTIFYTIGFNFYRMLSLIAIKHYLYWL